MQPFRIRAYRLFLICLLTSMLACSPTPKSDEDLAREGSKASENATFSVVSLEGESQHVHTSKSWNIPVAKTYRFKACVIARGSNSSILGHKFRLNIGNAHEILETDERGCLQWQERLSFNFFADSKYVVLERLLEGEGTHAGSQKIKFALNPWGEFRKSTSPDFIDLKNNSIDTNKVAEGAEAVEKALAGTKNSAYQLWLDDLSVNIRKEAPEAAGIRLDMNFQGSPSIKLINIDGDPVDYTFKKGQFRIQAHLISSGIGKNLQSAAILTANAPVMNSEIGKHTGKLNASMRTTISTISRSGNLDLAIRVIPVEGPPLKSFEAVYAVGDIRGVIGSKKPVIQTELSVENTGFDFNSFLAKADNYEIMKKQQALTLLEPYEYDYLDVRFERIKPGETSTTRTVEFRVKACITEALVDKAARDQVFDIDVAGRKTVRKSTDHKGCLVFVDEITHKYYKPENLFKRTYTFKHVNSGAQKVLYGFINPWDDKWTFGRDERELEENYIKSLNERKKIPSQFLVRDFDFDAIRFMYEIDEYMNLQVKKMLLLDFNPRALRYNSIVSGRNTWEPLRDGLYLMKVAVHKHYFDPSSNGVILDRSGITHREEVEKREFISVVKKVVRVQAGRVITPITITVNDLRLMRIRSQFLIQMETIDEKKMLLSNVVLLPEWEKLVNAPDLTQKERAQKFKERQSEMQNLLSELGTVVKSYGDRTESIRKIDRPQEVAKVFKEFDFSEKLTQKALATLDENDFTFNPTAPIIELDSIVDKDSGLRARSFVGPIVMLKNGWTASMRPTDNLDEKHCTFSDCDQIKTDKLLHPDFNASQNNKNYVHSQYYGSTSYLYGMQVDDFIKRKQELDEEYKQRQSSYSLTKSVLDFYNLEYVSLAEKSVRSTTCDSSDNRCLEEIQSGQVDSLVEDLNRVVLSASPAFNKPISRQDLIEFVNGRKKGKLFQQRICQSLMQNLFLRPMKATLGGSYTDARRNHLKREIEQECLNHELITERKHRIYQTGKFYFTGSKQMNINVGASVGLSYSESVDNSQSVGIGMGWGIFRMAGSHSKGMSESDGTSISESTFLVMQEATFDIELQKFEKCAVIRLNPSIYERFYSRYSLWGKNFGNLQDFKELGKQGYFLCSGQVIDEKAPLSERVIRERFYYFAQHFTEGDMLDYGDIYNHPWLLQLRGIRDMFAFVSMLKLGEEQVSSFTKGLFPYYTIGERSFNHPFPLTKIKAHQERWPIEKMIYVYRRVLPTFPGFYTLVGEQPDYPFTSNPQDNFRTLEGLKD